MPNAPFQNLPLTLGQQRTVNSGMGGPQRMNQMGNLQPHPFTGAPMPRTAMPGPMTGMQGPGMLQALQQRLRSLQGGSGGMF